MDGTTTPALSAQRAASHSSAVAVRAIATRVGGEPGVCAQPPGDEEPLARVVVAATVVVVVVVRRGVGVSS